MPQVTRRIVFWTVLLFFLAAAIEALGLQSVSNVLNLVTAYLPRLLLGLFILFAGLWLGEFVRAFLAASVVGIFENTIAQFTALAVLLPVVAGQSGNTGAQALAVTMRGLALREIRLRHSRQVPLKETLTGAINGVAIAVVTGFFSFLGLATIFSRLL